MKISESQRRKALKAAREKIQDTAHFEKSEESFVLEVEYDLKNNVIVSPFRLEKYKRIKEERKR